MGQVMHMHEDQNMREVEAKSGDLLFLAASLEGVASVALDSILDLATLKGLDGIASFFFTILPVLTTVN